MCFACFICVYLPVIKMCLLDISFLGRQPLYLRKVYRLQTDRANRIPMDKE